MMNKKIVNIMLAGFFLTALLSAADFRSFKRDLKRSGAVTEQAYPALSVLQAIPLAGASNTSPIVYKGLVFIGDNAGNILAYDASGVSSVPVWSKATSGQVVSSMVADKEIIYAISQDGNLYALNYATGELLFTHSLGVSGQDKTSPAVYAGCLYGATGYPKTSVYCFNLASKSMVWTKDVGNYVHSSPAFGDGIVYIGVNDGKLYALDAYTGETKWYFQTNGGVGLSSPCVSADGSRVYFTSGNFDKKIYAFNAKTGELIPGWGLADFGANASSVSSITEEDGVLYFVRGVPAKLYAVYAATGVEKWNRDIGNPSPIGIVSSPVAVNGVIYVGSADNKLYAINAADGSVIVPAPYTVSAPVLSSPAVANGKVYVCAGEMGAGYLYIYQAEKVSAITFPEDGATIKGNVTVKGELKNSALTSYKLEYSYGATNNWVKVNEANTIPGDGVVGSFNTDGLSAGAYSLRLTANDGTSLNSRGVIGVYFSTAVTSPTITAATGGTFITHGAVVIFSAGALSEDDAVTVDLPALGTAACPDSSYPVNFTASTIARSFTLGKPANASFKNTVTIKLSYTGTAWDIIAKEKNLRLAVWDAEKGKWLVVNSSRVDTAGKFVVATVSHFSVYRIFEYTPGVVDVISKESVYVYPNPAFGNEVVFKCFLGSDAAVTVTVYNIAGEKVALLTSNGLGGNGVELPWNIKDYASGAYIFKLEAVAATGERKYVTKKFAIIH